MDRAEKIGLGTALGGHLLLFAALSLGLLLSTERIGKPASVSVSLVGEDEIATAPDAVQEDTAPPPPGETQSFEMPAPEVVQKPTPDVKPITTPPTRPSPQKIVAKPPTKQVATKVPVKQVPAKPTKPGGFSRDFDKMIDEVGNKPGDGKVTGTVATKTAAQYRTAANTAIGAEVKPFIPGCAPPTSDNSSLNVFVALQIGKNANLIDADIYDVRGVTSANQAQVETMKRCVLESLRRASPYNLEPDGYDTWKNHKVQLKVNFK